MFQAVFVMSLTSNNQRWRSDLSFNFADELQLVEGIIIPLIDFYFNKSNFITSHLHDKITNLIDKLIISMIINHGFNDI